MAEEFAELLQRGEPIAASPRGGRQRIHLAGFPGLFQSADNWCWAAVAATVATFYGRQGPGGGAYPQCAIVDRCGEAGANACRLRGGTEFRTLCSLAAEPPADVEQTRQEHGLPALDCIDDDWNRQGFLNRALRNLGMYETSIPMWTSRTHDVELHAGTTGTPASRVETRTIGAELDFDEIAALIAANRLVCLRTIKNGRRHFIIIYGIETYPDFDLLVWDPANGADMVEADRLFDEYGPFTHKIVTRPPAEAAGPC
jgi:hypothetical protein